MRFLLRRVKTSSRHFEPIKILPFTEGQKRRLVRAADDASKSYAFPFNLSDSPPAKWVEFFQTTWYRHYGGDLPRVDGGTILAVSTAGELQNTLSSLKLAVTSANEKYQTLLRQQEDAEEAERSGKEDAKSKAEREMSDALKKLNF